MEISLLEEPRRLRPRKLDWKTEWLVYNFYVRCNISMKRIATLFGIRKTLVHDVVYAWANVMCETLSKFFPAPTRSQMRRAYPKSIIKNLAKPTFACCWTQLRSARRRHPRRRSTMSCTLRTNTAPL